MKVSYPSQLKIPSYPLYYLIQKTDKWMEYSYSVQQKSILQMLLVFLICSSRYYKGNNFHHYSKQIFQTIF